MTDIKDRQGKRKRTSGVVIPHKPRWNTRMAGFFVYLFVKAVAFTIRFKLHDYSEIGYNVRGRQFIFCIWHNRLALSLIIFEKFIKKISPDSQLAAMVSASRDGAFLTHILRLFGVEPVRGSSSRRGPQALWEMVLKARSGFDLAITPDGPRGPRYEVQYGTIDLSKITGLPIVPVGYSVNWKIRFKSWDGFILPLPFSRCDVFIGKPIYVSTDSTEGEREAFRKHLEDSLKKITID